MTYKTKSNATPARERYKWVVVQDDDENYAVVEVDGKPSFGRMYVCNGIAQGPDDGHSDARLIAAAPELLEALKFCAKVLENQGLYDVSEQLAFDQAQSAISKAEGGEG